MVGYGRVGWWMVGWWGGGAVGWWGGGVVGWLVGWLNNWLVVLVLFFSGVEVFSEVFSFGRVHLSHSECLQHAQVGTCRWHAVNGREARTVVQNRIRMCLFVNC